MRENKHIEKELLFKNNIKDITSISLDSNYKIEDNYLIGEFLVDGSYKIHELSINKENFNYKIPFKHELSSDIKKDSVKIEIDNFTYDFKEDELIVNIDYSIIKEIEDVLEFDSKELLDDYLRDKEVEIINDRIEEIKEEEINIEPVEERQDDKVKEENNVNVEDIVNKINNYNDFVTYKIYKVNENETIESIVIKNHTSIDDLKEYNDLNNISIGDKIIIPKYE